MSSSERKRPPTVSVMKHREHKFVQTVAFVQTGYLILIDQFAGAVFVVVFRERLVLTKAPKSFRVNPF